MLVDLQYWYPSLCASNDGSPGEQCPLISMSQGRQSCITGFPRSICWRRTKPITQPLTWPHPWQYNPPPTPAHVTIDLSNHLPCLLPSPAGWDVLQRNGRILITAPGWGWTQRNSECSARCMESNLVRTVRNFPAASESLLPCLTASGC